MVRLHHRFCTDSRMRVLRVLWIVSFIASWVLFLAQG